MKNEKNLSMILIVLSSILFILSVTISLNTNDFKLNNKINNKDNNQNQIKEEDKNINTGMKNPTNKEETNKEPEINNKVEEKNETTVENNKVEDKNEDNKKNNITSTNKETVTKEEVTTKSENNVISYFESQDNLITSSADQEDSSLREKVKNGFVSIVDFIFYDKEIKGYKFKDLTTSAKLKVIKIALSIDNKIDEYFPDYKDVIKNKYDNIKGKLAVKYLEFTKTLCDTVGETTCNHAKEDFNTMKKNFGITWQLIKELAKSGSNKVKEFYETWKDS